MPEEVYDLVCLVADADAERFLKAIIARGIERRCIAPIRWRVVIDPMKDSNVVRQADSRLRAFAREPQPRIVVLWDHHGSGRESEAPNAVEASVVTLVARTGIPAENILALAAVPEFETILGPVWDNVPLHIGRQRLAIAAHRRARRARGMGTRSGGLVALDRVAGPVPCRCSRPHHRGHHGSTTAAACV